ncbi:MAG: sugar phosphate isomerase/epimerase [Anaerolineae bacterium]|nr:sugar phosphate isomerase/epimerase [Anaerolineae bacterium]
MKLGIMSAAFPNMKLEQLVSWAAENGFRTLELACWPPGEKERRYAGVTHIDVTTLSPAQAQEILGMIQEKGLEIAALGYYPNPLDPDTAYREHVIEHLKKVIQAAELLGVKVVGTFIGRDWKRTVEENFERFQEIWPPIVRFAADHGVKIAIENCPMLFSYDEWPGGKNLAYSPAIWRRMFELIPDTNFGLTMDPSHLVWQFIDYVRVVYEFKERIFHVHAKDMQINREMLYQDGILGLGFRWQIPRLPGLGEVDWPRFISALYAVGYGGAVCIEHEDRSFEATEELVKQGFLIARNVLAPLIV